MTTADKLSFSSVVMVWKQKSRSERSLADMYFYVFDKQHELKPNMFGSVGFLVQVVVVDTAGQRGWLKLVFKTWTVTFIEA